LRLGLLGPWACGVDALMTRAPTGHVRQSGQEGMEESSRRTCGLQVREAEERRDAEISAKNERMRQVRCIAAACAACSA
jgi:hypothetical protein